MDWINIIIYASIYVGLVAAVFYILSVIAERGKKVPLFTDEELPSVSIIIPAWNEEKSIAKMVESILEADYPKEKLEVIVVNNNSKDKTLEIAKSFEGRGVRVYTEKEQGKGNALNLGISKAKGEIIFTMDADTYAKRGSMKKMVRFFKDPEIMSVTPAMLVHNPKGIWQKIQHMEYILGVFLRKAFASLNSIFISPGAFSAYRKSFFDKHGGYDVGNITEDLEMSLRIQYHGYRIENCPEATVYTNTPKTFKGLLIQRRRWNYGLLKNTLKYRKMMGRKYGDLGIFVMPMAWISVFFSMFLTGYMLIKSISEIRKQAIFLHNINFNILNAFQLNWLIIEKNIFLLVSNPVFISLIVFSGLMIFYSYYARKKSGKIRGSLVNIPLFLLAFGTLFGVWWIVSFIYALFNRKVSWR